ncbi:MAG: BMC domain-containing protein [Gorillibacterium sp.]|nr:BMC domain-containing protein [Gorillibacterium sp.]
MIETVGYTTAVSAADAALKAANVTLIAVEKVIGVAGTLGVTIHLSGDVSSVSAAVEAGKEAAQRIGTVISAHVIAKAHDDVNLKILSRFTLGRESSSSSSPTAAIAGLEAEPTTATDPKA